MCYFIIGLMIGGSLGVMFMTLMVAGSASDKQ